MQLTVELLLQIAGIIAGSWFVAEIVIRLTARAMRRAGASPRLSRTIRDSITIVWILLAATGILTLTGIASEFSFLTISGIVGLTVSLALQSTLSNMISGILLLTDGVIRVDDVISFSSVKGRVVKVGFRSTWVKTDSGEIVVMSNSNLSSGPFVNYTAARRLERKLRAYDAVKEAVNKQS